MKESIFFEKDGKIYKATKGALIENVTDRKSENISVAELFGRDNGMYGIVLFARNDKWPIKAFDVEPLEDF